jgi:hypothetical protein
MEQMSDEDVMRFAPPEIRRLWRKLNQVEEGLAVLQAQQREILAALADITNPETKRERP